MIRNLWCKEHKVWVSPLKLYPIHEYCSLAENDAN